MQPDITLPKEPRVRVYRCLLSQTGTNAPVERLLQNTFDGTGVWTRSSAGRYKLTLPGSQLPRDKRLAFINQRSPTWTGIGNWSNANEIEIWTYNNNIFNYDDNQLFDTAFEVYVYTD